MFSDRVKETTTTTGTGTVDLLGAVSNFVSFVTGIGNGNLCYYAIVHTTLAEWEVGIGTVTDAATDTLSRTTVLGSSNAGALVNFSAGTKDVFNTIAANEIELAIVNTASKKSLLIPPDGSVYASGSYEVQDGFTVDVDGGVLEAG